MANRIKNYQYSQDESFKMSNGWTDNFYEVLLLSASELAKTNWEKDFAIWIAQHDYNYIGTGMGFDVAQIPWTKENFQAEKAFVLNVIKNEKERTGWRNTDYSVDYKTMLNFLHLFEQMINHFTVEMIDYNQQDTVLDSTHELKKPYKYHKCPIHKVYLHGYTNDLKKNCLICNFHIDNSTEDYLKDMRETENYKKAMAAQEPLSIWTFFTFILFILLLIPIMLTNYFQRLFEFIFTRDKK